MSSIRPRATLLVATRLLALNLKDSREVGETEVDLSLQQLPALATLTLRCSLSLSRQKPQLVSMAIPPESFVLCCGDRTSPYDSLTFWLVFRITFISTGFTWNTHSFHLLAMQKEDGQHPNLGKTENFRLIRSTSLRSAHLSCSRHQQRTTTTGKCATTVNSRK